MHRGDIDRKNKQRNIMREEILKELDRLESEKNIRIVYAVESGSRAWGFSSTDSDWDVRFVYVHTYEWYLSVEEKKDNIEIILPNDIDLAGWELRKALLLFRKSNPPLLEWLRSPIVYREALSTANRLKEATVVYFNPKSCLYHYLHMARRNYEAYFTDEIVRVKKYFYVLRPLLACCWIEKNKEMAPIEFDVLMDAEIPAGKLRVEIDALLDRKKTGEELDKENRIKTIDDFIENKLEHYKEYLTGYSFKNTPGYNELNEIFRQTLKEAWTNREK
jgi:predicted nucleotidyltransferase